MVARIITGTSIRGLLHYNENKIVEGEAKLIMASGFAGEIERMGLHQKLHRFQYLTQMRPNVKTNALHISLNFHSSEQLKDDKLQEIAAAYMEKIGFGDQPFLVYRHDDAAHQHLHIVSTNITASRERIDLHDIGKLVSEPARKQIEEEFKLVKAESKTFKQEAAIKKVAVEKVRHGKMTTKRAISNVITATLRDYQFTSLAEYNALLKCFNVTALRGAEHTKMFEKQGLMYSVLDEKGMVVGVPIKASAFYTKPTLAGLQEKFEKSKEKRKLYKQDLTRRIDQVFSAYHSINRAGFEKEMKTLGVDVAFRENEQGTVYGVTFVDHWKKAVFNGSDLGKAYSAKAITERLSKANRLVNTKVPMKQLKTTKLKSKEPLITPQSFLKAPDKTNFLAIALGKTQPDYVPSMPSKRRKKKRKGQQTSQELSL